MSATIKQIAELSGVSRGTVDRVLNNRGKVKPQTEAAVRRVAEQLGYQPNLAGKALAVRKKAPVIGVVVSSEENPFFEDVLRGVARAQQELKDYGVRVLRKPMKGYDVKRQLALIDEIRDEINVLILNPINDPKIAAVLNDLQKNGVGVITMNNDIENCDRLCYVGCDYIRSGRTACGMIALMTNGQAKVGLLPGSKKILGHNQRVQGFINAARERYPQMEITGVEETEDDDIVAFETTKNLLAAQPQTTALFVAAAGTYGVCRAVEALHKTDEITIVCCDAIPSTVEMMEKGVIEATICQQPFTQGNKSVHIAFDYVVSGMRPQKDTFIVKNEIKILENL
ncbi:MAG: substrate-binding domain-containing protein [Christensenella sp.]|uniref:LacI family DNA-binding transcriptional regulator n=1 Tax=Christensenella sp. TaxID=1935934 RepID=UPI002B21B12D|nr:substrate-binding domain-containing protein [Christensenella sp.]MEA5003565.1 substrate-binding domain-containing protein [Christensenella sp.]